MVASLHSFVLWAKQTSSRQKIDYLVGINESKGDNRIAARSDYAHKTGNPHKKKEIIMAKNIFYQLKTSVDNSFKEKMDKHSIKQTEGATDKIYSYAARKDLIDFSHRFADFIKENYPNIKQVKDISVEQINSYLLTRKDVSEKTLMHDVACINKMELCASKKFGLKELDWKTNRVVPHLEKTEKVRSAVFTNEQIQKLNEYMDTKRDCDSKMGVKLCEAFQLRASEVVKLQARDFIQRPDGSAQLNIVDSKGKRSRVLELNQTDISIIKNAVGEKTGNERLVPVRPDSVCAYLTRCCKDLGFTNITDAKTSIHALRKYGITKFFDEQKQIYGEKRAKEMAMERLGHSATRSDLFKTYIVH